MNLIPQADTSNNSSAPDSNHLKSLAGAFISIQVANKAISLQPRLPEIEMVGLEDVNASLTTAQENAVWWTDTVSANVQNQLQHVVSHTDLYSVLAPDLENMISALTEISSDSLPDKNLLVNISDTLMALQESVQSILYGTGGTKDQPRDNSVMGTYKQLTEYQQKVRTDETTFADYKQKTTSDQTGIASQIQGLQDEIAALRKAISNDQTMIAGGAAAIATGIGLVVAGVALTPETGGAGVAVAALGVAAIAGGVAADTYGLVDMAKKQDQVSDDLVKIHDLNQESAALTAINHASGQLVDHATTIFENLGNIITNWQQMDNDISNAITGIELADSPDQLGKWINEQANREATPSFHLMGMLLHAKLVAPQNDWAKAAELAQNLLNGIANVRHVELPPQTKPTQDAIAAAAYP